MGKRNEPTEIVPIMYVRYSDGFGEALWTRRLNGPFEAGTLLQAIEAEAGAKGMVVIVQVGLVEPEVVFGPQEGEGEKADGEGSEATG